MEKSDAGNRDGCADNESTHPGNVASMTSSNEPDDLFAEYMWMGDPKEEDEVNLQVMEEIIEEEFIESCFEDMLEEEALGLFTPPGDDPGGEGPGEEIIPSLQSFTLDESDAVAEPHGGVDAESRDSGEDREGDGWTGGASEPTPSGFGGQSSDGESETSESDSLGDTPQR